MSAISWPSAVENHRLPISRMELSMSHFTLTGTSPETPPMMTIRPPLRMDRRASSVAAGGAPAASELIATSTPSPPVRPLLHSSTEPERVEKTSIREGASALTRSSSL